MTKFVTTISRQLYNFMLKSEETKIYNWANLLKNNNGGKPMLKDVQAVKNNKG